MRKYGNEQHIEAGNVCDSDTSNHRVCAFHKQAYFFFKLMTI